jgi:hypothetical protein
MLTREKEEGICIHRQTSAVSEQTRIVKKDNVDRAVQATIAAGMATSDGNKNGGKNVKKGGKITNLKQQDKDDSSTISTSTATTPQSQSSPYTSPSTPKVPINKEIDEIQANYLKSIGKATNTFVESAPGSRSPRAKPHPNLGSSTGDHSQYENLQSKFKNDVTDVENKFIDMMEELEYGASRPRKDTKAEAERLLVELEALKKSQLDVKKWSENLTIDLDDMTLKSNEYIIDVHDAKTNIKITSPDKSPEILARKKVEEEARQKEEAEEAARRMAEEEARKKKEAAKRAIEDETRRKKDDEEATSRAIENKARKHKDDEEVARRAAEDKARKPKDDEEAARRAAEDIVRKQKDDEEATRRAGEDIARKKKNDEEAARRAGGDIAWKSKYFE